MSTFFFVHCLVAKVAMVLDRNLRTNMEQKQQEFSKTWSWITGLVPSLALVVLFFLNSFAAFPTKIPSCKNRRFFAAFPPKFLTWRNHLKLRGPISGGPKQMDISEIFAKSLSVNDLPRGDPDFGGIPNPPQQKNGGWIAQRRLLNR